MVVVARGRSAAGLGRDVLEDLLLDVWTVSATRRAGLRPWSRSWLALPRPRRRDGDGPAGPGRLRSVFPAVVSAIGATGPAAGHRVARQLGGLAGAGSALSPDPDHLAARRSGPGGRAGCGRARR